MANGHCHEETTNLKVRSTIENIANIRQTVECYHIPLIEVFLSGSESPKNNVSRFWL